ncbi:hypothetical protein [Salinisphaera sp. Q1T1-3]|uniref:hypothetical protein n=1 Tax=Salinisphaera sp. Q1T1-3 TaxID=2321229 RepID=UPI000E741BF0|nr:hypothetical protein [Salinisphaera sp. Q1T1-3]RJS93615.1 hypothetical protein D3260_08030 [Salinisphaera sp. Q1T1-3]
MTDLIAAALLVCSALFFSLHRLVIQQSRDRLALLAGFNAISIGVGLALTPFVAPLPLAAVPYLLASAVFYSLAMMFVTAGYRHADFGAITPLQSAIKIVMIAWLAALFLDEPSSLGDWIAAGLVVISYIVQIVPTRQRIRVAGPFGLLALAAGLCSGLQYVADVAGIRQTVDPLPYIVWNLTIGWPVVLYGLFTRRRDMYLEFRLQRQRILIAAALDIVGYSLILLVVYQLAVLSILPLLNLDIVFSALIGAFILHEARAGHRLIAAALLLTAALISQLY